MPDEAPLGEASVRIVPDLSGFEEILQAKLEAATSGARGDVSVTEDSTSSQGVDNGPLLTGTAESIAALEELGRKTVTATEDVDISEVLGKTALADATVDEFGHKRETATLDVDSTPVLAHTVEAVASIEGVGAAATGASEGISALFGSLLLLGPALVPITAVGIGGLIGLVPIAFAAAGGLGAVAAAAYANKDAFTALGPQLKLALDAFGQMTRADVLPMIANIMPLVTSALAAAVPIVHATAGEIDHLLQAGRDAFTAPFWRGFSTWVAAEAGPAVDSLTSFVGGLVHGLAGMSMALAPVFHDLEHDFTMFGQTFAHWGDLAANSTGFQQFVAYIEEFVSKVGALFSNLFQIIGRLAVALAPLGGVVLTILDNVLSFVNSLLKLGSGWADTLIVSIITLAAAFKLLGIGGVIGSAVQAIQAFRFEVGLVAEGGVIDATVTKLAGFVGSVGGIGPALLGIGGPLAIAAASIVAFGVFLENSAKQADSWKAKFTQPILSLPTGNLDQIDAAMASTTDEMHKLVGADGMVRGSFSKTEEEAGGASMAYDTLKQHMHDLHDQKTVMQGDLLELQDKFGLNQTAAMALAQSLNINLGQALDPTKLAQFKAALQEQAAQAGFTSDALNALAASTNQTTAAVVSAVKQVESTTRSAYQSFGDLVSGATAFQQAQVQKQQSAISAAQQAQSQAQQIASAQQRLANAQATAAAQQGGATLSQLQSVQSAQQHLADVQSNIALQQQQAALTAQGQAQVSASDISGFYEQAARQASSFGTNIQTAMTQGYNPDVILQLLEQGPQKAGPVLSQLVANAGGTFEAIVNLASWAIQQQTEKAVEMSRLAYRAANATSDQLTKDYTSAVQMDMLIMTNGSQAAWQAYVSGLSGGLTQAEAIAREYGITIPQKWLPQIAPTAAKAGADGASALADALGAGLTEVQQAAQQLGITIPDNVNLNLLEKMVNAGDVSVAGLAQALNMTPDQINQVATALGITGLAQTGQQIATTLSNAGTNAIDNMFNNVDPYNIGKNVGVNIGSGLTDGVNGINWAGVGTTIDQGIGAGFITGASDLLGNIKAVMWATHGAAMSAINSQSPSKLYADTVGISIPQGIAVGILAGSGLVAAAVGAVVANPATATRVRVPSLSGVVPVIGAQPTSSSAGAGGTVTMSPTYHLRVVNAEGMKPGEIAAAVKPILEEHDAELLALVGANNP